MEKPKKINTANFIIMYDIVTKDVSVFNICLLIFLIKTEIFFIRFQINFKGKLQD